MVTVDDAAGKMMVPKTKLGGFPLPSLLQGGYNDQQRGWREAQDKRGKRVFLN